jgi:FkbM family methyltransferase
MSQGSANFDHEYDLEALIKVSPAGQDFSLYVTPRYRQHYDGVEYEAFTAHYLKAVLPRAGIFVDVGAHYGFFSLLAASAGRDIKIIAIEPVPESRAILTQNIQLFTENMGGQRAKIDVCAKAVSDKCEERSFKISLASDSCSFYSHPNAVPLGEIMVETTSIDALLEKEELAPLVVKIDTDGHELAVLRGMQSTLGRFQDVTLIIELNPKMLAMAGGAPEQLISTLDAQNFAMFIIDEDRRQCFRLSPGTDWSQYIRTGSYANLICLPKARALSLCFFAHSSGLNGAERSLATLVKQLIADFGAVCTVVFPSPGPLMQIIQQSGASCLIVSSALWCRFPGEARDDDEVSDALLSSAESFATQLVPLVREIDPDIIYTQTMVTPWGAAVAACLKKPHIWSVCEYGELDHGLRFIAPFHQIVSSIDDASDLVLFNSYDIKSAIFPELANGRWEVIYRHVEIDPVDIREQGGTPNSPLRLALVGTLSRSKGQMDAIEAVALLKTRGLLVELSLVGEGYSEFVNELRQRVNALGLQNEIHFTGFVANPYPLFSQSDIVLICSRREAFGRVAVEAMLMGKAVIYSDAGGVAEIMRDGVTGLSYRPGAISDLAERIEVLARDPDLRLKMGATAKAYASDAFSREHYSGKFYRSAQELLARPRRLRALPAALAPVIQRAMEKCFADKSRMLLEMKPVKARLLSILPSNSLVNLAYRHSRGIHFRSLLRHPFSSSKRKAFRAQQQSSMRSSRKGGPLSS